MAIVPPNAGDAPLQWSLGGMRFDAWLRLQHNTGLTITQHPVETGASITDHSYFNPRRFSFDIGMTDCIVAPQFPGDANRSVNAYNALVNLQGRRERLTLVSKYGIFPNILIESVDVSDDYSTKNVMKATISLLEIIVAKLQTIKVSADPQVTDQTNKGQVPPQPVPPAIQTRTFPQIFGVPGAL